MLTAIHRFTLLYFCFYFEKATHGTALKSKDTIFVFPVSPGSVEALVRWGGKFSLLTFSATLYAKKTSNSVLVCQSYSKQKCKIVETWCSFLRYDDNAMKVWWKVFQCFVSKSLKSFLVTIAEKWLKITKQLSWKQVYRFSLLSGRNVGWPCRMLVPGESRWVCRRDRQTDGRQTVMLYSFRYTPPA